MDDTNIHGLLIALAIVIPIVVAAALAKIYNTH